MNRMPGDYKRGYKCPDDIQEYLSKIVESTKSRDIRIKHLQEENQKLKDGHYKDVELANMKEEVKKARKDLVRGFPISEKELTKINKWQKEHEEEFHGGRMNNGAAGGGYEYIFYPTGIGTFGTVKCCVCNREFEFQSVV